MTRGEEIARDNWQLGIKDLAMAIDQAIKDQIEADAKFIESFASNHPESNMDEILHALALGLRARIK